MGAVSKKAIHVLPAHQRKIKKVAVLGSGVMGSGIACHFANIGLDVLLLDIVPFDLKEENKNNRAARNRIVDGALKAALKSKPAPLYDKSFASRIATGNFDDDLHRIKDCDWVIEVVVENLKIKQQVFDKVEQYRRAGTLITSNTSGIPIQMMLDGRSEDFKRHFCGTHFFNPPRYLKLFEIIPSTYTDKEVINFFTHYASLFLGKTPVLCKDTPAFIANRVGVYAMAKIFQLALELELTIEEVDALTGPVIGRPKTGTFKLADLVGLDTATKVIQGIKDNCPNDEQSSALVPPAFLNTLLENKWLGNKTKQGFYKKIKDENGKRGLLALDLKTVEYRPADRKPKIASLSAAKKAGKMPDKIKSLFDAKDKGGDLIRKSLVGLFSYVSNRIPEISDNTFSIDDALRTGFAWKIGPFQYWDIIGISKGVEVAEKEGMSIAPWVKGMLKAGHTAFYKIENGVEKYYDIQTKSYQNIPGRDAFIVLDNLRANKSVWKNSGTTLHDLGDGILNLEFQTKMNAIGGEVLQGINKAIDIAEKDFKGLVIGNDADNFSAGANLAMIFMLALEQDFDELNMVIKMFQKSMMRLRYSSIPTVAAPHGMALGGGCETVMHCDAAVAAAETYIGLVEVGVGLIPAGGGTKEFALRAADESSPTGPQLPALQERFGAIATAKVATSAYEGFDIGVLNRQRDKVVVSGERIIAEAKQKAIQLADAGYTQPVERHDILVQGRTGLSGLYAGIAGFQIGNYASEHDAKIARKIAYVLSGGDLSQPTKVSEQYLLDLEREAFLSLLGEKKTLERIQSILKTGKPLRN